MLSVTVYSDINDEGPTVYEGIDYVSLVSDETYGPPAVVAPTGNRPPVARPGDRVLYLNTKFIPMWEIERVD